MTPATHERSLVVFTLLLQLAVGAFLAAAALDLSGGPLDGDSRTEGLGHAGFIAIVVAAAAGLAFSFLHLGTPGHAWRALANLRRSWLSREILFALGFAVLAVLFAALRVAPVEPSPSRAAVAVATALCGLALIYAMARVYRLRTMPAWDTPLTTLSFFSTTCLLGSLAAGAAVALWGGGSGPAAHLGVLAGIAAGCFVIELGLEAAGPAHTARVLLLLLGAALTIWVMLGAGAPGPSLAAAFAAAVAAQVVARIRFFRLGASQLL